MSASGSSDSHGAWKPGSGLGNRVVRARFGRNPYEHGWKCASKMVRAPASGRPGPPGRRWWYPRARNLPLFFGIITGRTGSGRNSPDSSKPRISSRNAPTPTGSRYRPPWPHRSRRPGPFVLLARSHASARNSRSQTRLTGHQTGGRDLLPPSGSLACISRTVRYCATCRAGGPDRPAPGFPGASSGITVSSLSDTLPPFPM